MSNVFVGFYYDDKKAKHLLSVTKGSISAAANQYQQGFLCGLEEHVEILTTTSIGMYPRRSRQLFFKKEQTDCAFGAITYLPFVNFYFVKDLMFRVGLQRALSRLIEANTETTVYIYSLNVVFEKVMAALKRKYGDRVRFCLIIPDLPGEHGIVRKGVLGVRDRMEVKPKMALARWADSYVFLTEAMQELFPPKPYAVVEGFLPLEGFDRNACRIPKSVLYTGTLAPEFGINTLLEAFSSIEDPDAQLWICGAGGVEEKIKAMAQQDSRIQFKGFLPKDQIAALQSRCDVLVNPRTDEGAFTKYSFPSKTMEYLLSGSKVVMYRLPGIGEEYYRYIRTVEQPGAPALAKALQDAFADKEFYQQRSGEQIQWITENKSARKQIKAAKVVATADK